MPLTSNLVKDIMIKDVVTVSHNAPLGDAADLMMENRIGCLIVMRGRKAAGILTERDFVKLVKHDYARSLRLIVDDIISGRLITVTPETTAFEAFSILDTYNIKRLPVVEKGLLKGLITLRQILVYSRNTLIDMLETTRTLKREADIDDLTGTYNKRYLLRRLKQEFDRSRHYGFRICIIFMDIDFFKRVNDTYNHSAGDYILRTISKILRQNIRNTDILSRFGGEEFVIITPYTKTFEASYLANKLRVSVEDFPFSYRKHALKLTISAGVASLSSVKTIRQALERADKALYRAKKTGRNRVCRWQSSTNTIIAAPFRKRQ
ncbi:diguanylate cyclase [Fibrobacterota bacterium]